MIHTVAILLFSRTAGEEALHKPFSTRGEAVNRQIAGHFISHAENVARRTGLPVVHVSSAQQQGDTFGERIVSAFRLVFAQGYGKVLAIGNDCPYLTPGLLQKAARQLLNEPVVLGPARDGGAYLIGLSAEGFRDDDFGQLAWQTPVCYASLLTYCLTHGLSYAQLPPHHDLNNRYDVACFLRARHQPTLVRRLARFLNNLLTDKEISRPVATLTSINQFAGATFSRRGPPLAA